MLILAEGTIHRPIEGQAQVAADAWIGPMVDSGFLQSGYLDEAGKRVWLMISAPDRQSAKERLGDLPVVRDGSVTFVLTHVTAVGYR